jgi:hypothetical protein
MSAAGQELDAAGERGLMAHEHHPLGVMVVGECALEVAPL